MSYTPYQQGIIKRFYEHRDTLALQKLGEMVSNLYLETSEKKLTQHWARVHKQLVTAGVPEKYADKLVEKRELESLAKILTELGTN